MKFMIGTAALLLVLSTPAFPQEEPKPQQQGEHKPQDSPKAPAQEKAPAEKPAAEQPREKQAPAEKPAPAPPKAQEQEKQKAQEKQTEQQTKQQQAQQKQAQKQAQQQQQKEQQAQSHNQPAHNGGNGNARRIPDDKFRAHFGPQHHFRVARGGGNRFQYGGYWFVYTDPWPVGWSYDDDCYIEDDGGVYYLIDALHPDLRLVVAVEVS